MLYRPPQQARQISKTPRKNISVRLKRQDAFKFLAGLKPGSVDLIVSSPPYCMGKIVDPFMGSGSSGVAAAIEHRRFRGCDVKEAYVEIAATRIAAVERGEPKHRSIDKPIYEPNEQQAVAKRPIHFAS